MHQMASEVLLRQSPVPSCSSRDFYQRLKASDYSACRFLSLNKGLRWYPQLVCRTSSQRSLRSQAATTLPKLEGYSSVESCEALQQSFSPDRWMENCVCDIVRNLNEAPFLHMLFEAKDSNSGVKSQRQRVIDGNHLSIDDKWREVKDSVRESSPDGVIMVHHLADSSIGDCRRSNGLSSSSKKHGTKTKHHKCSDLWGVLVLGRDVAKSACYILKTTSMASSFGTCTQFCLTKAKCFGPSWQNQAQSCWLFSTEDEVY